MATAVVAAEHIEWDDNIVPPMTHELSRSWHQPSLSAYLIDSTHAIMSLRTFEALHEYSGSKPSGVYEGKMWRRHDGLFDEAARSKGFQPVWLLCWYGYSKIGSGYVSNHYRKIILIDGELPKP